MMKKLSPIYDEPLIDTYESNYQNNIFSNNRKKRKRRVYHLKANSSRIDNIDK